MKPGNIFLLLAFAFAVWLSAASYGLAQTQTLEEVVVTATKRGETSVQAIATSIFAASGDVLDERSLTDFEELAGGIPGFQFQDLGPGDKEYIIRGINGTGPSTVGAYFDEFVITATDAQDGGGKNAPIKLVDLERIEVLNGPQGTLYGANSMAGNIKFIPRKPDASELSAFADVDFSDFSEGGTGTTVSGAINIPAVEDKVGLRFTGWYTDNDGWIDQPRRERTVGGVTTFDALVEDINSEETTGGRFMLRLTPSDALTLDLLYLTQSMEIGGSPRFTAAGTPAWPDQPPEIAAIPGNPGFAPLPGLGSLTPSDDFVNSDITVNTRDDDVDIVGATLQWDLGAGTITASAGRYDHDIRFVFDSTPILLFFGVPVPGITTEPQSQQITMFEGRFASNLDGPVNFLAGVYYQEEESDFEVNVTTTDGNGGAVAWDPLNANDAFVAGGTAIFGRFRNDTIEQQAAFGEVTIDFAEQWQLLFGLRLFDSELESIQATTHGFLGQVNDPAGELIGTTVNGNGVGRIETDDDTVNPKVSLSFEPNGDTLLYATYSEGFRVGGVNNANQPFAMGIPATYASDEITNLEFGIKSRFADGRIQLNATLFTMDWEDIQVEPRDPAGNIPFITNGGEAEVNGVEWALRALLTERLDLTFTGTHFFQARLTEDQPVLPGASPFVIVGQDGDDIPNVPQNLVFASLKYDIPLAGTKSLSLIGDVTFRDRTNTEFRADNPFNIELDAYTLLDLYANLHITDRLRIGAYVRNATDELAVFDGIGTFQDPEAIVAARPRTIGVGVNWSL